MTHPLVMGTAPCEVEHRSFTRESASRNLPGRGDEGNIPIGIAGGVPELYLVHSAGFQVNRRLENRVVGGVEVAFLQ